MSTGSLILIIIACALGFLLFLFMSIFLLVRYMAERSFRELQPALKREGVLAVSKGANYFGRKKGSMAQLRGNGILTLNRNELAFYMIAPKREYHIPLERIEYIEHPRTFRGRAVM